MKVKCEACGKEYDKDTARELKALRWNAREGVLRAHCPCGHILDLKGMGVKIK